MRRISCVVPPRSSGDVFLKRNTLVAVIDILHGSGQRRNSLRHVRGISYRAFLDNRRLRLIHSTEAAHQIAGHFFHRSRPADLSAGSGARR